MNALKILRASRPTLQTVCRTYATGTSTTPPMLLKIRKDLKTAMQQKDTARLTVLRALLASTLNASKTSSPINTDMQMLSLLRKTAASSKVSVADFKKAGRQDLVEKEESQIAVLEGYMGDVEVVGVQEIQEAMEKVVKGLKETGGKVGLGEVMRAVTGELEGKNVDKGDVARVVKEVLAAKS